MWVMVPRIVGKGLLMCVAGLLEYRAGRCGRGEGWWGEGQVRDGGQFCIFPSMGSKG